MKWAKLAVPSHSETLWWEKIRKHVKQAKLAVPGHSEHFSGRILEKLRIRRSGHSESISVPSVEKYWKSCESGKIGHSESF